MDYRKEKEIVLPLQFWQILGLSEICSSCGIRSNPKCCAFRRTEVPIAQNQIKDTQKGKYSIDLPLNEQSRA